MAMHGRLAHLVDMTRLFGSRPRSHGRFADDWDTLREGAASDRERAEIDAIFRACTEGVQGVEDHASVGDAAEAADVITL
jgi:hypothetical protein